jgi:hypothetical protein
MSLGRVESRECLGRRETRRLAEPEPVKEIAQPLPALASRNREKRRGASEGRTVPFGPAGQHNRQGGKAPWFGVRLDESRGGRLA